MSGRIFISYRRGEDTASAGRLYDRLNRAFRHRLFMDLDSIPPGEDFVTVLEREVAACDVLLALIGRGWLSALDEGGRRRLDNPADFVRIEIGAGLGHGKRVIPVLIDTAAMPREEELPDDLRPLIRRNAVRIGHERFEADSQRLIKALRPIFSAEKPAGARASAAPSLGASASPSPASGQGAVEPLSPGEVGASVLGEGAAALKLVQPLPAAGVTTPSLAEGAAAAQSAPGEKAAASLPTLWETSLDDATCTGDGTAPKPEPKSGVHVGVEPRTLPDLAVFKDIDAPWCPEMVIIPTGAFLMGSLETETGRFRDEGPRHRVTIGNRFALARHAVTVAEYRRFVAATGHDQGGGIYIWTGSEWKQDPAKSWVNPGFAQDERHPVVGVNWRDAEAFASWLSREVRQPYRLPTEAEWEYACRAGTTTPFSFGATISTDEANYDGSFVYGEGSKGVYRQRTVAVGSLPPNPWGIHEMHGNVWECVEDVWHDDYSGAPVDGSAWRDDKGKFPARIRVVRGGSWNNYPGNCRSASRFRIDPDYRKYVFLGFRLARTLT